MSNGRDSSKANRQRELFVAAVEQPAHERVAFLARECGEDHELRQSVEALLKEHDTSDSFLSTSAVARDPGNKEKKGDTLFFTTEVLSVSEQSSEHIGRYKLLQQIGEGGCGVVYMAEQEEPVRRRVALKIIKQGMDTKGVIARFEVERQALAMMDHPNIARVLDGGATETGRPYFVMELVRGVKITDYADENELPTKDRLKLFIQVCQAIQHAHQKGIIHRDIKPSNILVTLHDGVPVPKVIDFGIAKAIEQKLTDKTLFTQFQSFIGTPAYMSPEQAEMSGLDIDTRGDVYSLGVLLYELLTGKTPFDPQTLISRGIDECRRTIREDEPARPSQMLATLLDGELTTTASRRRTDSKPLIQQMRGDLDWIVMKCLEKNRARRYETTAALAADVQRYLDTEPIMARPPSRTYRLRKTLRKHRGPVAAALAIAVTLVLGAGISIRLAVRATKAEAESREKAEDLSVSLARSERSEAAMRLNGYVTDINLAQHALEDLNVGRAVQLLSKHHSDVEAPDLRGFEWRYLAEEAKGDAHESLPRQTESVQALTVSPDGRWIAASAGDSVKVFYLSSRLPSATLTPSSAMPGNQPRRSKRFPFRGIDSIAFLKGEPLLVTASQATVRLWNTKTWREERTLDGVGGPIAISDDGKVLATEKDGMMHGENGGVVIWDTKTWQQLRFLPDADGPMVFAPDHERLATDSREGIKIWSLDENEPTVLLADSTNFFGRVPGMVSDRTMAFTPDGLSIVAARNTISERGVFLLSIWDVRTGEETGTLPTTAEQVEHTGVISSLAFSPDGRTLATGSMDHSIRLWDFQERELNTTLLGHLNEVWTLAFSPDGDTLVSGDKDGAINIWQTTRPEAKDPLPGITLPLGFSKDGGTLAALSEEADVVFVNLATGEPVRRFPIGKSRNWHSTIALSDDLRTLAQGHRDGSVTLWNTDSGETDSIHVANRPIDYLTLSPDGRHLLAGAHDQMPHWWDLRAGTNSLWDMDGYVLGFSPDGESVVCLRPDGLPEIYDVETRSVRTPLELMDGQQVFKMHAFSPDGKQFAASLADHTVGLWDMETGDQIGTFSGHKQPVYSIAFSPDGKTLATSGADSTLRLWNVATRQQLLMDRQLGGVMVSLVFSPDGQLLMGGSDFGSPNSKLRLYHAPTVTSTAAVSGVQ